MNRPLTSRQPRPLSCTAAAVLVVSVSAAQPNWNQLAPSPAPGPRNSTAMVFDEARGVAVLYGGFGGGVLRDTWEWNGTTWTDRMPATDPGPLNGHAMAYDIRRRVTVLFGGARSTAVGVAETWEWDGTTWTQRATSGPQGRVNHQLAYDAARGVTVLFGGHVNYNTGPNLGDTWEWDGTTWTQRAVPGPSVRTYHAMAYDLARARTVLFGGRTDGNVALNDTWEWDGTAWTLHAPATSPSARIDHEMAYDPARRRCVIFAGFSVAAETWEWNGTNWTQVTTATTPAARYAYGFCWDNNRHRVLMFGGYRSGQVAETWTYGADVGAAYVTAGSGCPGTGGVPTIAAGAALPWIGETFSVQVTGLAGGTIGILGGSDTNWLGVPLPLDLSRFGITGCRLYVSFDVSVTLAPSGGSATWSTPLPNVASLVGRRFFQQAASLSPGTNPLGVVTSNYGAATMGAR